MHKSRTLLTNHAKALRNNPTDAEKFLWQKLKSSQLEGVRFRRQEPIEGYIVDFVSFEKKIILELDGGQHEVFQNLEGVLEVIRKHGIGETEK